MTIQTTEAPRRAKLYLRITGITLKLTLSLRKISSKFLYFRVHLVNFVVIEKAYILNFAATQFKGVAKARSFLVIHEFDI